EDLYLADIIENEALCRVVPVQLDPIGREGAAAVGLAAEQAADRRVGRGMIGFTWGEVSGCVPAARWHHMARDGRPHMLPCTQRAAELDENPGNIQIARWHVP